MVCGTSYHFCFSDYSGIHVICLLTITNYIVDELKEYFSTYGNVVEYQIMLDHKTGRSRGFGFVTFDSEDSVEKVFSAGKIHEIGGKQVSQILVPHRG